MVRRGGDGPTLSVYSESSTLQRRRSWAKGGSQMTLYLVYCKNRMKLTSGTEKNETYPKNLSS